jgi:hypothetical protein
MAVELAFPLLLCIL